MSEDANKNLKKVVKKKVVKKAAPAKQPAAATAPPQKPPAPPAAPPTSPPPPPTQKPASPGQQTAVEEKVQEPENSTPVEETAETTQEPAKKKAGGFLSSLAEKAKNIDYSSLSDKAKAKPETDDNTQEKAASEEPLQDDTITEKKQSAGSLFKNLTSGKGKSATNVTVPVLPAFHEIDAETRKKAQQEAKDSQTLCDLHAALIAPYLDKGKPAYKFAMDTEPACSIIWTDKTLFILTDGLNTKLKEQPSIHMILLKNIQSITVRPPQAGTAGIFEVNGMPGGTGCSFPLASLADYYKVNPLCRAISKL